MLFTQIAYPQNAKYTLPEPVMTELGRLDEAYQILDQFSRNVWDNWDDYMDYPFLFTFQNGLRVLVGHPNPPSEFSPLPDLLIHGLKVYIDTTNVTEFVLNQPFICGGGPISFGSFNNKHVTIVDIRCSAPTSSQTADYASAEFNILAFIHELMHCFQLTILENYYEQLRINPDLNISLFADIEGQALAKAYEQPNYEASIPFLKDFCIARIIKLKDLTQDEKDSYESDEFCEGEAVYSEFIILQSLKNGFTSCSSVKNDTAYKRFNNPDTYLRFYLNKLKTSAGNTLNFYDKKYWYGCFQAVLLQNYFPGWQKEIENGKWLDQILRESLHITNVDSLNSLQRFHDIYNIDSLRIVHGNIISERNETYQALRDMKGRAYIIDLKPIHQFVLSLVDKSRQYYELGEINMFPSGLGELRFDKVSISFEPVLSEVNQLFYVKLIDENSKNSEKPYEIKYESKDDEGFYYNVTVTTPLFVLKAPKISIIKSSDRIKFIIHSRV